ncbi:DoxX family protein [Paucibacter sp. AS339]|uniref:DoxX family protein n=1 Tax=Paucibacter hankyongi TaxID=3133434 RepID=UPI0030AFE889
MNTTDRNTKTWLRRAALLLLALPLLAAGAAKLAGVPQMHISFALMGLPAWFGYFIGAAEVAGAIGLFIWPLRAWAASGIAVVMLGALGFHALYTPLSQGIPALILLVLSLGFSGRSPKHTQSALSVCTQ